ncbi:hypothetical protein C0992_010669, partial [Termitomyces sp. T32_za158]
NRDLPAIIKFEDKITHLAGSIDYVTLNYHLPEESEEDRLDTVHDEIAQVVDGKNAARAIHFLTKEDTFTLCEAKRKELKLYQHEPQVVAQCLAL